MCYNVRTMGDFNRDDRGHGSFRSGFGRGGRDSGHRGFSRGRSSFGGGRSFDRGNDRGPREMFKTVCSNCGKECEVPFRPTNGKPVYCSDCFEEMGNGRSNASRQERSDFRPHAPVQSQNNAQLDTLNAKLDKIIGLLEPKKIDIKEEVVAPKVKKTTKKTSTKKV